jgi:hypothetical protein
MTMSSLPSSSAGRTSAAERRTGTPPQSRAKCDVASLKERIFLSLMLPGLLVSPS